MIKIGHNNPPNKKNLSMVSDEKIKEIVKDITKKSFESWKQNKLKKGIDTSHLLLDKIAPNERLIATIIQSLQTSLGQKLWEKLTIELASLNSFEICDKKIFQNSRPKTKDLDFLIDKWHSKRADGAKVSLRGYILELKKEIKKNQKKFKKIPKSKVRKGDGVDVWLKKKNKNYLLELKSPHINAGNGNDFSKKLMRQYQHHLFWDYKSKVKALVCIPYNPFDVPYEKAEKGRISPLVKNEDYLVDNDYWKFITGNGNAMKIFKEVIDEIKEDGSMYNELNDLIKNFQN